MPAGAAAWSRATTAAVLAALGIRKTSNELRRYTMRSSIVPPSSSQQSEYCALPGAIRSRSAVRQRLTNSAAPVPRTTALPRWLTSNTPTASRTAVCSLTTPEYSRGISQPPNSANFAPRAT